MYVDDAEIIEIKTCFGQEQYTKDGHAEKLVDCTEEWNRYLETIGYKDEV